MTQGITVRETAFQKMWVWVRVWGVWEDVSQVDFEMLTTGLISSAFPSRIFSRGSHLEQPNPDSVAVVKLSWLWTELFLDTLEPNHFLQRQWTSAIHLSLYFRSVCKSGSWRGHFLFYNGYNSKKNSFALLNQVVQRNQAFSGTENVCHSCLLPNCIVPGEMVVNNFSFLYLHS